MIVLEQTDNKRLEHTPGLQLPYCLRVRERQNWLIWRYFQSEETAREDFARTPQELLRRYGWRS